MHQTRKDVLNGWKEIAAYLGRDPRTVERWEKQRSLPVRRLPGSGRATVYALVAELDAWLNSSPVRGGASDALSAVAESERNVETFADPSLPGAAGNSAEEIGAAPLNAVPGWRGRRSWLRLAAPAAGVLVVCFLAFTAAGRHVTHSSGTGEEPAHLHTVLPRSRVPGVEELYLRGSYLMEQRTPESLGRARDAFQTAIGKDAQFAPAYAGLAGTFLLLREYSMLPDAEAYPRAMDAASRALQLNPDLPQARAAMGFADFFWRWDAGAAEQQFQRALAVAPDLSLVHHWYGSVLVHEGRFRAGAAELATAQRLDPGSGAILTTRALALGLSGKRAEANELLQDALARDSAGRDRNPATMHSVLGMMSLLPPRNIPRYLAEATLAAELRRDDQATQAMEKAAAAYRARGEEAMWKVLLEDESARHRAGVTYARARYEAELGDSNQALHDFAELLSRHDPALIGVSVDPLLLNLHREPRFQQLRAAMGLPAMDDN